MSFQEVRFPTNVDYTSGGGPKYLTEIVEKNSGHEQRNKIWTMARHNYHVTGLREDEDFDIILDFFHAMAGMWQGFRFRDWGDWRSIGYFANGTTAFDDQIIGVGDGIETEFQLVKRYSKGTTDYDRTITKPVTGSVTSGVDGVEVAASGNWSVDTTTGIITYLVAPLNTLVVTAGFEFDVPVRFDTDQLDLSHIYHNTGEMNIPLIEVRV